MKMNAKSLVEQIRAIQVERGWSDGELSRRLGRNGSEWSRVKNGQRKPTMAFLAALARVIPELKTEIDRYIFGKEGEMR